MKTFTKILIFVCIILSFNDMVKATGNNSCFPPVNIPSEVVQASLGTVYVCGQNTITLPMTVTQLNDVIVIDLTINFNGEVADFQGYETNPALSGGDIVVHSTGSQLKVSWISPYPVNVGTGTLFSFSFSYLGGNCDFDFDTVTEGYTYFADQYYDFIPAVFSSGSVQANPVYCPAVFNVTPGGSVCQGDNTVVGLDGSEIGVNYFLYLNDTQFMVITGTGMALSFGVVEQPGTYTVQAVNTYSSAWMTGSLDNNRIPYAYDIYFSPAGDPYSLTICPGRNISIWLMYSEDMVEYELYRNNIPTGQKRYSSPSDRHPTWSGSNFLPGEYTVIGRDLI
ncbi:MAG: hypothetical protein NTU44_10345 [Bacteroidetes bacterium]|nr:hypothetical protein [Bacteroidota bacterium]